MAGDRRLRLSSRRVDLMGVRRRLLPTGKTGVLAPEDGWLSPPGEASLLPHRQMGILAPRKARVLPSGHMKVRRPGNVTIPLVSGVVAFR